MLWTRLQSKSTRTRITNGGDQASVMPRSLLQSKDIPSSPEALLVGDGRQHAVDEVAVNVNPHKNHQWMRPGICDARVTPPEAMTYQAAPRPCWLEKDGRMLWTRLQSTSTRTTITDGCDQASVMPRSFLQREGHTKQPRQVAGWAGKALLVGEGRQHVVNQVVVDVHRRKNFLVVI
jgi:hypothetical protein